MIYRVCCGSEPLDQSRIVLACLHLNEYGLAVFSVEGDYIYLAAVDLIIFAEYLISVLLQITSRYPLSLRSRYSR